MPGSLYLFLCSSAGSVGTFLASQSSHLNNAFIYKYYLPERALFRCFFFSVLEEPSFPIFSFLSVFFDTYIRRPASSDISTTPSTRQHSAGQSTRTSSKARTRRSERDNASKQADRIGSSEHVVGRRAFMQLAVFAKRRNQNLPGLKKYTTIHKGGVILSVHCSFSPSYFVHACGVQVVSVDYMELSAFASRQFGPKTMDLSVRFFHSHFAQFL